MGRRLGEVVRVVDAGDEPRAGPVRVEQPPPDRFGRLVPENSLAERQKGSVRILRAEGLQNMGDGRIGWRRHAKSPNDRATEEVYPKNDTLRGNAAPDGELLPAKEFRMADILPFPGIRYDPGKIGGDL